MRNDTIFEASSPMNLRPDPVSILVVDDERAIRALIQEILQNAGYPVIAATCATEALQLYEEHQSAIRLLVTDVIMRVSVAPSLRTISCDHGPSCRFFSSPAIARITALPCTVLPAWQNPSR